MNKCSICQRRVKFSDLCGACFKEYGRGQDWVEALIKLEQHRRYLERKSVNEISFVDLPTKEKWRLGIFS